MVIEQFDDFLKLFKQYAQGGGGDIPVDLVSRVDSLENPVDYAEKFDSTSESPVNGTNVKFILKQAKVVRVSGVRVKKSDGTALILWRGDDFSVDVRDNSINLIENENNPIPIIGDMVGVDYEGREF